ncbi:putative protein OS=Ureibacillus acetophenoni OX=614649 GN=SAMN05877842_11286 PE=4 SV=1 [Ureibacillus acetophenoni]
MSEKKSLFRLFLFQFHHYVGEFVIFLLGTRLMRGESILLPYDEIIYKKTAGQIGKLFESTIQEYSHLNGDHLQIHPLFGAVIPLDFILLRKDKALNTIMKIVNEYWGNIDLFLFDKLQDTSIDLYHANDRLQHFFNSTNGKQAIFQHLNIHHHLRFDHVISLVFGKEIEMTNQVGGLNCIYLYRVGNKYFIHVVYNQKEQFWKMLFTKKIYSIFLQTPVLSIDDSVNLMKQLKLHLEELYSTNKTISLIHELITELEYSNPRSFQLKELQLINVTSHYNGGKRHRQKLSKIIQNVYDSWGDGRWALTEKEETVLTYMLTIDSYKKLDFDSTIAYGEYLIQKDRLNNHAIELIVEFSDVIPNIKPEPSTLIKLYNKNYIEKIFYILINAYVHKKHFHDALRLLKDNEIASCTAIYEYLNQIDIEDNSLHRIEATVQRDIIFIVDHSPQHIKHSLDLWLQHYQQEDSPYYEIAIMSSKHISNILKTLFATKHYDLFDKLMEVYTKYLKMNKDFNQLRDFVVSYVK